MSVLATFALASCTTQKSQKDCTTYEEATLPVEVTTNWSAVPSGIQASVGSIDVRYVQHEVPEIAASDSWSGEIGRASCRERV